MNVNTTRFGTLEVDDTSIIKMPRGPLGFEEQTDYCLLQHRPDTSFRWLQSVVEPGLAFVVVDPTEFFTNYDIEIPDSDAEKLNLSDPEDALVLVVVTMGSSPADITVNLAAPIIVNSKELIGMQVVLQDNRYQVKHAIGEPKIETMEHSADEETKETVTAKAA